jgi:uncharacterized HAD superfamily protein
MKLIIDIDGTICEENRQFSRSLAKPLPNAVKSLKALKKKGYILILYSARTWAEYEMTLNWLKSYDIPFDQLILGKPEGDYWIDDRAIKYTNWKEVLENII